MSFFKELKEDIAQSVNELGESIEGATGDVNEDSANAVEDFKNVPEEENEVTEDASEEVAFLDGGDEPEYDTNTLEEEASLDTVQEEKDSEDDVYAPISDEETIISPGTVINGSISSESALTVKGIVNGGVSANGKLTITGKVAGDVNAAEIYLNTSRLEGDLTSKGSIKIDVGTVIVGEIKSDSLVIAGAVKGNSTVEGAVIVDSTAVVKGDISGKSIQINSGAIVDGHCSLQNAGVDLDTFFE